MIIIKNKIKAGMLFLIAAGFLFTSCNKDVQQFAAIPTPVYPSSTNSIAKIIAATPTDSLYYRMIVRAGMVATLNDSTRNYTMFITDNNGMKIFVNAASGGLVPLGAPDAVFSGFISSSLPVASAAGIIQYNTVAQAYPSASIPATFPNTPLPTQIILDPVNQFPHMVICPVKSSPYAYTNNIPFIAFDEAASNGVIHHLYTVAAPPSAVLKTMIAAEPTLSYFRAAIARADSGQVGLNRFDSLLNYGLTNMTVLAPNDAAFQALVFNLVYSQVLAATGSVPIATATANGAVAAGPAFLSTNNVTSALVRGIIAYHFLATNTSSGYQPNIRVFAEDIPAATAMPFFIQTLVNGSVATHPGVIAIATYTGPAVTSLKFVGLGPLLTPTTIPYSGAPVTAISTDKLAVNGVYHILNGVLLPQ
jgi:hypothetical protein